VNDFGLLLRAGCSCRIVPAMTQCTAERAWIRVIRSIDKLTIFREQDASEIDVNSGSKRWKGTEADTANRQNYLA
jgi:hypothetical protein